MRERARIDDVLPRFNTLLLAAVVTGCGAAPDVEPDADSGTASTGAGTTSTQAGAEDGFEDASGPGRDTLGDTPDESPGCGSLQAAIQGVADAYVEEWGIAGVALAARAPACPPIEVASGLADVANAEPLTVEHRSRIASITKSFTAAVLLVLQQQGLVDLDAPISDYLDSPVPNADQVSVRQLLNHTSGINDYLRHLGFAVQADGDRVWEPEELVEFAVELGPLFEPGEGWEYSNTNYILAGLIVEAVSGLSLGQAIRTHLLEPVGLHEAYFDAEEVVEGMVAHGHELGKDITGTHHPSAAWAAGAMVMTADDLARWTDALVRGPVLSAASREQLLEFVATETEVSPYYGLGVAMRPREEGSIVGHGGLFPGYTSGMGYREDSGHVAVALVNEWAEGLDGMDVVEDALLALEP